MTDAEYTMYMDVVASATRLLLLVPLDDLLDIVNRSETLGPILQPTAFNNFGARRLREQQRVLEAALQLRKVAQELVASP